MNHFDTPDQPPPGKEWIPLSTFRGYLSETQKWSCPICHEPVTFVFPSGAHYLAGAYCNCGSWGGNRANLPRNARQWRKKVARGHLQQKAKIIPLPGERDS